MFRFKAVVLTRGLSAGARVRLGHLCFRSAMGDAMPRMLSRLADRACSHQSWAAHGKQSGSPGSLGSGNVTL